LLEETSPFVWDMHTERDTMTEHIEQAHWEAFLNDFSKTHHGFEARMEILGRDFGDQEVAAWLPFTGISYDPHHHQIFVTVGGISSHYPIHLTHTIDSPRTVAVRYTPAGEVSALLMTSGDKTETLVTLRRQPQLAR
jgi:hypothetical protein